MPGLGTLTQLVIEGLFGQRDRHVEIDFEPGKPTVLTGANGSGKSTVLRVVDAIANGDGAALLAAPVWRIEVTFSEAPALVVERQEDSGELAVRWGELAGSISRDSDIHAALPVWAADLLESNARWSDDRELSQALMTAARSQGVPAASFRAVRDMLIGPGTPDLAVSMPDWFDELTAEFPVLFVTDQRLVVESTINDAEKQHGRVERSSRLAVEAASQFLASQMTKVDSAYARASQIQDLTFLREIVAAMNQSDIPSIEELTEALDEIERRREGLREVGLIDPDEEFGEEFAASGLEQENVRPVIATFLAMTGKKLDTLSELEGRLRAFKSFLDERFVGKSMTLDRREGVRFRLDEDRVIRPSQLSSGEQQMMVLAYEILFRAAEGTLVIIDEPEISLHVLWQDTLIDKLTEMGRAANLQFLMASHSPVLLANHPEVERSLDPLP